MPEEYAELLDAAIYKEIVSQALYNTGQKQTGDAGAQTLMKELAEEELKHSQWLKKLKEKGIPEKGWHQAKVPDLMISDYLTGGDTLESAGLQDLLVFAIKRQQQAIEFYSRMMSIMRDRSAKRLCQRLVREELRHKYRLETFYDDLFYGED